MPLKTANGRLIRWPYEYHGREYELHVTGSGDTYSVDWHAYLATVSRESRLLCALRPVPEAYRRPLRLPEHLISSILRAYLHCTGMKEYTKISAHIASEHQAQLTATAAAA